MRSIGSSLLLSALLVACSQGPETAPPPRINTAHDLAETANCKADNGSLRLNEVQSIGSHNSYKKAIPPTELSLIRASSNEAAMGLDYFHLPITEQLDLGMRQLELDIFHDPDGGRYSDPVLPRLVGSTLENPLYDATDMDLPGFKTMHVQDVDMRSHCALFTTCLTEISIWSTSRPNHTPLLILINAKQSSIELPGAVTPLPFDAAAFDALDAEIRSVFSEDQLITPDDVRGTNSNLRGGVLLNGWPELADARGKVMFALDESPDVVETYLRGKPSLQGHPMFVNTIRETADHAAYFTLNDPIADSDRINAAVDAGFLVRTRADADTREARTNDTTRREAALASSAQYISTDYYVPREALSSYQVRLPYEETTRCRP